MPAPRGFVGGAALRPRFAKVWLAALVATSWGAGVDASYVRFVAENVSVHERKNAYATVFVERVGNVSTRIEARVIARDGTAKRKIDYEISDSPLVWNVNDSQQKAFAIQLIDDEIYEDDKYFNLELSPQTDGAQRQTMSVILKRDDDGGFFVFSPESNITREEPPVESQCLVSVKRIQGHSGEASVYLLHTPCNTSNEARKGLDFEYMQAPFPMTWLDGQSDSRCALWKVPPDQNAPNDGSRRGENALRIFRDHEVEANEAVCFEAVLGRASSASIHQGRVRVELEDLGLLGGGRFECSRGLPCSVSFSTSSSIVREFDDVYVNRSCAECCKTKQCTPYKTPAGSQFTLDFGRAYDTQEPGWTDMCVCRDESQPVIFGGLSITGPSLANNAHCKRGAPNCTIPALNGHYETIAPTEPGKETRLEFVHILVDCKDPKATHPALLEGGRAAMKNDNNISYSAGDFVLDQPDVLGQAPAGIYRICWCKVAPGQDCMQLEHFSTEAGLLVLAGPQSIPERAETFGTQLVLEGIAGVSLGVKDRVRMQRVCGRNLSNFTEANISMDSRTYDFGVLQNDVLLAGRNQLCWCQVDEASDMYCNESTDFRAWFGDVIVQCPQEYVNNDGRCSACHFGEIPNQELGKCVVNEPFIAEVVGSIVLGFLGFFLFCVRFECLWTQALCRYFYYPWFQARRIVIDDISPEGPRTIVTTRRPHRIGSFKWRVPVKFIGAGGGLERAPEGKYWTVVSDGPRRLEIFDSSGKRPEERLDGSMGLIAISIPRMLLHAVVFDCFPLLLVSTAMVVTSLWVLYISESESDQQILAGIKAAELALALFAVPCWREALAWMDVPRLEARLWEFDAQLNEEYPNPGACERGPGRAIIARQLFALHDFFSDFIKDRTMYYLDTNIIRPLCSALQLSYAERAGPYHMQWFVSHYWGTEFRVLCESIRRHASAVTGGVGESWKKTAYWISAFSSNQFNMAEELGNTHEESAFYLALRSGTCKGTCMILDEQALPLTRSWCLFEVLQTIQLPQAGFAGLLFCTPNGVLNFGGASGEVSMGISKKLAGLSLENSSATHQHDKDMISSCVMKELGSLDIFNRRVKDHIQDTLQRCASQVEFAALFTTLKHGMSSSSAPDEAMCDDDLASNVSAGEVCILMP